MDSQVFLFMLAIVLGGGVIGVLADNLGRKIGKKRLVIWKLRPKHTARVGTFLAGVLVSLLTIIFVFALSAPVRKWIVRGTRIVREYQQLQSKEQGLEAQVEQRQARANQLDQKLKQSAASLTTVRGKLAAAQAEIKTAQALATRAQVKAGEAVQRYERAQTLASNTKKNLVALQGQYKKAQVALKTLNANIQAVGKDNNQLNEVNLKLTEENQTLNSQKASLVQDREELQNQVGTLKEQISSSAEKLAAEREQLSQAKSQLADAQVNVKKLNDLAATLKMNISQMSVLVSKVYSDKIIFGAGDELARIQVGPNLTQTEASAAIDDLVSQASAKALAEGASKFPNSIFAADFGLPGYPETASRRTAAVQELTNRKAPAVVIASSALNSVKGNYVIFSASTKPDPIIYKSGAVIATRLFNPGLTTEEIFEQLQDFIQKDVYQKSITKGMIPAEGRSDSLLNVGPLQLFPVIEQISKIPYRSELKVFAEQDIRAGDRLQIRFYLRQ